MAHFILVRVTHVVGETAIHTLDRPRALLLNTEDIREIAPLPESGVAFHLISGGAYHSDASFGELVRDMADRKYTQIDAHGRVR